MRWLFLIFMLRPFTSWACLPNEIHIREQWIDEYKKEDGTMVSAHLRSQHCREIKEENYFQDSSSKKFKGVKGFKKWKEIEKSHFNKKIEELPSWLKKYKLSEVLRADTQEGNSENPVMTIPAMKTLIVFDKFFAMFNQKDAIVHELAHIAAWDIDPVQMQDFFISNGWIYEQGKPPTPPKKVIFPDSSHSPSEDFANSVEMYYSNSKLLKEFNPQSFLILESIIKSKEKQ